MLTKVKPPLPVAGGFALKPASGRVAGAVILGVMAAFWNGVVWTMLIGTWRSDHGLMAVGMTVFLGLFVLIGLLLAGLFIHQLFKALFTPRPSLILPTETVDPTRTMPVRWSLGQGRRPTTLRIALVLREECQYRRGTDTVTDQHVVRDITLFEQPEPGVEGTVTVTIPADLPPSFSTKGNQLVWAIRFTGAVPGLPDIDDEFPLTVQATAIPASLTVAALPAALPDGTPALALAETTALAAGTPVAGVINAPGEHVTVRLRWETSGKGDRAGETVSDTPVPGGVGSLIVVLPNLPPAWSGTVLSLTWHVDVLVGDTITATQVLGTPSAPATPVDALG